MWQAGLGFAGGVFAKTKLDQAPLPQFRRAQAAATFTLSVQVVDASIVALNSPGVVAEHRPFLIATLSSSAKTTEFASFSQGPGKNDGVWRFGDTLTFKGTPEDVFSPGLRLAMKVRKDVKMGPLRMELSPYDVGEGALHLKNQVLSACVHERKNATGSASTWSSDVLTFRLFGTANGESLGFSADQGNVAAYLRLAFTVDTNPQSIAASGVQLPGALEKLENAANRLGERLDGALKFMGLVESPAHQPQPQPVEQPTVFPTPGVRSPDEAPEGWVSKQGPNGRIFWHNLALGPPPWGRQPDGRDLLSAAWQEHRETDADVVGCGVFGCGPAPASSAVHRATPVPTPRREQPQTGKADDADACCSYQVAHTRPSHPYFVGGRAVAEVRPLQNGAESTGGANVVRRPMPQPRLGAGGPGSQRQGYAIRQYSAPPSSQAPRRPVTACTWSDIRAD